MPKAEDLKPAHTIRLPGNLTAPSSGKSVGAVRSTKDAYQGERKEKADPSERKPVQ
jgi:hypothetical protein